MNKMTKRMWSFLLAFVLVLATILPAAGSLPVYAETDSDITVKLHYNRPDGNYTDWDVWIWGENNFGGAYALNEENGEMVATIEVPSGLTKIGFIVRKTDWSQKDVDADQYIEFPEVKSGTYHAYVESGVKGYTREYGEDLLLKDTQVKIHYSREDKLYDDWDVWMWCEGKDGAGYPFVDENGEMVATMVVPSGTSQVGYIVRKKDWSAKDPDDQDRYADLSNLVCGTLHIYFESGKGAVSQTYGNDAIFGLKVKSARLSDDSASFEVQFSQAVTEEDIADIKFVDSLGNVISLKDHDISESPTVKFNYEGNLDVMGTYYVVFKGVRTKVTTPVIYSEDWFEEAYTYEGDDLGLTVGEKDLTFKVWAPMAEKVMVNIYEGGTANANDQLASLEMTAGEKGVFSLSADKKYLGKYYTYVVTRDGVDTEVCDPYARSTGVNGNRAMILDLDTTDPEGWDEDVNPHAGESINEAVIYEVHMRDLSADESSGIKNVGKFLEFTETGTKTSAGDATGIDHIADLGVTHVHILPMYDFGSIDETSPEGKYNWGYDPVNYNVPEGSYSTDPYKGEVRVKEAKEMVKALHENGLSVVMDVVYNHVQNGGEFCINQILPGYFSRISDDGVYSNGSGCGNDTASERSMVRKYIVDSVLYWATEYHIDGFRFDLVGLLDVDTINQIVEEVHEVRPDVIFYGEGWTLGTAVTKENVELATQPNSNLTPDFAYFNDNIRDGLKGSVFDDASTGYVSGAADKLSSIQNSWVSKETWSQNPAQIVQYASCHDNLTLFDKLAVSCPDDSEADRIRMNNLTAAIYLTAQGVPFIMAGEEMLRSKVKSDGTYDHNSYASPDSVNSIKWDTLADEKVSNVYEYYKGLIAFRKSHSTLCLSDSEEIAENVTQMDGLPENVLGYTLTPAEGDDFEEMILLFNPTKESVSVELPDGDYNVFVNAENAGTEILDTVSDEATVDSISALALVKDKEKTVVLNKTFAALRSGFGVQLKAGVSGSDDQTVTWSSSDEDIAKVNKKGYVTTIKSGVAYITAEADGAESASCLVVVNGRQIYLCQNETTNYYTRSLKEAKKLKADGWDASKAFMAAGKSDTKVYYVYAYKSKHYRYTTDRAYAIKMKKKGGIKAGVAFYGAVDGMPVYELVKKGLYVYTTDKSEAKSLKKSGYTYKGVAFYAEEEISVK